MLVVIADEISRSMNCGIYEGALSTIEVQIVGIGNEFSLPR